MRGGDREGGREGIGREGGEIQEQREKIHFTAVLFKKNKKNPRVDKQQRKYVVVHIV